MNNLGYQISSISIDQFATFDISELKPKHIAINLGIGFELKEVDRNISATIAATFKAAEEIIIKITVTCKYVVNKEQWEEWEDPEKIKIELPVEFLEHIAEHTMSTARGILHSKTESTEHNKFFLPSFDLSEAMDTALTKRMQ